MSLTLTRDTEGLPRLGDHDVAAHVRCERCGEPLDSQSGGSVVWAPDATKRYLEVAFLHPACAREHASEAGEELESAELGAFLAALIHNLEVAG